MEYENMGRYESVSPSQRDLDREAMSKLPDGVRPGYLSRYDRLRQGVGGQNERHAGCDGRRRAKSDGKTASSCGRPCRWELLWMPRKRRERVNHARGTRATLCYPCALRVQRPALFASGKAAWDAVDRALSWPGFIIPSSRPLVSVEPEKKRPTVCPLRRGWGAPAGAAEGVGDAGGENQAHSLRGAH